MCIKCKHRVFFDPDTKVLYYMDEGCNKVPLPADALIGGTPIGGAPSLPSDDELPQDPTALLACYKVNALWDTFEAVVEGLLQAWDDSVGVGTVAYAKFGQQNPQLKVDNWRHYKFWMSWIDEDDAAILAAWADNKADVKETFICALQDEFEKTATLSVADLSRLKSYDFDTPSGDLDDFMTDALGIIEDNFWKERAAYYTASQTGTCNCTGSEPTPPPQIEPNEGEFGLFAGQIVGNITTSITPQGSYDDSNPLRGVKVSETKYNLIAHDADTEQVAELFVVWEVSEMIIQLGLDFFYKYTGVDSDASHVTAYWYELYYSSGLNTNWGKLPGFVGEASSNDSAHPEIFDGTPIFQPLPWDDSLRTEQVKYIGFHLKYVQDSDNEPTANPSGEFTIAGFKAKAETGGNYRATLLPMVFVPKAL